MPRFVTVLLVSIVVSLSASAEDWPMYHFKPTHSGFNRAETAITRDNVKFLTQLWTGTVAGSILESSPVVSKGLVFIGSFDNKLYAFSAKGCGQSKCSPVWTGKTKDHITSSPAVSNGVVYVGSNDQNLYAFAA